MNANKDVLPPRLQNLTDNVAIVGFAGLAGIAFLTLVDVGLSHLGLPRIPGFDDLGEVIYAVIIASCFPAGLARGQQLKIELLGHWLGPRATAWFDMIASIATLIVFLFIGVELAERTLDLQLSGRHTLTIRMPMAPWWWLATAVFAISVPVQAALTISSVRRCFARGESLTC
jgi:TRAP-type C4-dicarboxylate transport system permease small subunit